MNKLNMINPDQHDCSALGSLVLISFVMPITLPLTVCVFHVIMSSHLHAVDGSICDQDYFVLCMQ